ncbi:MAG: zinc-dependent metalloprotease family protein [Planctomycetota bacterium]
MAYRKTHWSTIHWVVTTTVAFVGLQLPAAFAQDQSRGELEALIRITEDSSANGCAVVQIDEEVYRRMLPHSRLRLRQFPLGAHDNVDLDLEQFKVTTPTTRIVIGTPDGDRPMPHPEVALFRGQVVGEDDSEVFLGLSPSGSNGFVRRGGMEYVLTSGRSRGKNVARGRHVIYERSGVGAEDALSPFQCLTSSVADDAAAATVADAAGTYSWRVALVAIDCDYEYGQLFDNLSDAAVYAIELLGAIGSIYERDLQVRLHLPYLRIWSTSNDPYTVDNVQVLLSELGSHWINNMSSVQRDIVHLLSGQPGRAGLANVNVLCDETFGYGVSAGLIGAFPRPLPANDGGPVDTFDVKLVAHEMGHQFGSPHTHCYNPPIDYCGRSFDDCWNGYFQCQQGTLMSYCDRIECGGTGKDLRFHERVVTRIRQSVDASCLRSGLNPAYVDWANSGVENGSSAFPFNTVREGIQVVIPGGTLHIDPGAYHEGILANRPMILRTTGGTVRIGP